MSYKIKSKNRKKKKDNKRDEGKSENSEAASRRLVCHVIEPEEVEIVYVS